MSIDYGFGKTNIDKDNGIRYGVISANHLSGDFWDIVQSMGKDLDYEDALEEMRYDLERALTNVLSDCVTNKISDLVDTLMDELEFNYESNGDNPRYYYESQDGSLQFHTTSDGCIFVTKSPYYSLCGFCSPCAPGAGDLMTYGTVKTYCLGPEWFDAENPPYNLYKVS